MLTKNEIKDDPSDLFVETSISYMFSTWVGSASVNQIIHSIAGLSVFLREPEWLYVLGGRRPRSRLIGSGKFFEGIKGWERCTHG